MYLKLGYFEINLEKFFVINKRNDAKTKELNFLNYSSLEVQIYVEQI